MTRWTRWTRWTVLFSLLLVITSLSYLSILMYNANNSSIGSNKWVIHTHDVINNLGELLSTLKDAETGERGYLITGQSDYLEPYNDALKKIDILTRASRAMTVDNEKQQRNFDLLEPLITQRLDQLAEAIKASRDSGFEAARGIVLTNRGKATMDRIRVLVSDMQTEEQQLLAVRLAKAKATSDNRKCRL